MPHAKNVARICLTAGVLSVGGFALAMPGLIQGANIIVYKGAPVPDVNGVPIPGLAFGGTTSEFGNPFGHDEGGNTAWRGRLVGTGVTALNEFAWFRGPDAAGLRMVARGGDPVPGLTSGEVIGAGLSTIELNSAPPLAPSGGLGLYACTISGATVTTANDSLYLTGTPGALALFAREGDPAPGTVGATFGPFSGNTGYNMNRTGRVHFLNTLVGGDVVGTTNNQAWFAGPLGGIQMIQRKGDLVFGAEVISLGSTSQTNDAGQFVHFVQLSQTNGPTPATAANDNAILIWSPGFGETTVMRESDAAPGTAGAVFSGAPSVSPNQALTRSGRTSIHSTIAGGDVSGTTNDTGIWHWNGASLSLVVRENDAAPGTAGALFASFNANSIRTYDDGSNSFVATLRNGDVVSGVNDEGLFVGKAGALKLVVRKGQIAPGTAGAGPGSTFGGLATGPYTRNDLGQIAMKNTIVTDGSGSPAGISWWYFDPSIAAWSAIFLPGETLTINAVVESPTDFSNAGIGNNTDGAGAQLLHDGHFVNQLTCTSGQKAIFSLQLALANPPVSFCSGDGSGTACPCGNVGVAGRGCANSTVGSTGARLSATGVASLSNDSIVLQASDIPGPGLFFQGTGQFGGGAGIQFGDGLLCAGGVITRLGVVFPTGSSAEYPGGLTPAAVSVAGGISVPGTFHYQCWYRDAVSFCTSDTYNLTQGLSLNWLP